MNPENADYPTQPPSGAPPRRTSGGNMRWTPPSADHMARLLPQYDEWAVLGQGGMGAVYKAQQTSLDRWVAVKILPPEAAGDEELNFIERFKNEARTMAKMSHPGIVSVFDFGSTSEGQLYFIMEFIDGTDVAKMIQQQGRLPPEHALAITAHVCDALSYAHTRGVIHRDIKPANILINNEGQVKVADFGLARMDDPSRTSGLTKTGTTMGTPDFVSPEALIMGVHVDQRADLYAIGVMLYNMLCGDVPRGMFEMPSIRMPGLDRRFDAIIAKAMKQDREQRYQTAAEIRRDLDVILTMPMVQQEKTEPAASAPAKQAPKPQGQAAARAPAKGAAPAAKPDLKPQIPQSKSSLGPVIGIAAAVVIGAGLFFVLKSKPQPAVVGASPQEGTASKAPMIPPAVSAPPSEVSKPPPVAVSTMTVTPVQAPSASSAGVLPAASLTFAGHRYQAVMEPCSWQDANKRAEAMGGHLVVITSKEENDWIRGMFIDQLEDGKMLWIGATNSVPDKQWKWVTGETVGFAGWVPKALLTQPDVVAGYVRNMSNAEVASVTGWALWKIADPALSRQKGFLVEWDDGSPPAAVAGTASSSATKDAPFVNSLGMKFVPVPITGGKRVLFAVWHTRVQDYEAFAKAQEAAGKKADDLWKAQDKEGVPIGREPDHPVVAVSWEDAQAFCAWLTAKEQAEGKLPPDAKYRLPSDEEWSWAAGLPPETGATPEAKHGKNSADFPWGKDWPPREKVGNYADEAFHAQFPKPDPANPRNQNKWIAGYTDGHATTSPVGSFPANVHGLHDMGGNVWQWCEDWWNAGNTERVLRGNSFPESNRDRMLSSVRHHTAPGVRYGNHGFRCVLVPSATLDIAAVKPAAAVAGAASSSAMKDAPFVNSLGMKFVPVPITGGPTGGQRVLFSVWETRFRDFEVFVKETKHAWSRQSAPSPDHAFFTANRQDAQAFCTWLTERERASGALGPQEAYRLPSDHEWSCAVGIGGREDAALLPQAKDGRIAGLYPWGAQWPPPEQLDPRKKTGPVGAGAANDFGLHDLGGNLLEWCEDAYDKEKKLGTMRGAHWQTEVQNEFLSSKRSNPYPTTRWAITGFRCVLAPSAAPASAAVATTPAPTIPSAPVINQSNAARELFNGRDATGWTGPGGAAASSSWRIDGGTISSAERTTLWSAESFGDFELELEWKVAPKGNGGVFYHVPGANELEGPEMQLSDPANSGSTLTGGLFGIKNQTRDASKPLGEWNTAKLVVRGPLREHWVNGELVCAYDAASDDFKRAVSAAALRTKPTFTQGGGKLVLQANAGEVSYRNLRIKTGSGDTPVAVSPATGAAAPAWMDGLAAWWSRPPAVQGGRLAREAGGARVTRDLRDLERAEFGAGKNVAIRATLRPGSARFWGLYARMSQAGGKLSGHSVSMQQDGTGMIRVYVDGTPTTLATFTAPPGTVGSGSLTMEFRAQGDDLTCLLNGTEVARARSSAISNTGDIEFRSHAGVIIEKLEFADLDAPAAPPSSLPAAISAVMPATTGDKSVAAPADPRLAQLEAAFKTEYAAKAQQAYDAGVAALNTSYVGALGRARTAAQTKGVLAEVTAMDDEMKRIQNKEAVPPADAPGTPASLATLRKTYHDTIAKHAATRDAAAAPVYDAYLKALDAYIAELTRADKLEDALRVKALRDSIAAQKPAP